MALPLIVQIDTQQILINNLQMCVRQTGGDLPPLLMIHGHTDHGACWMQLAEAFADRYNCIMPDMMGHGFSSRLDGPRTLWTMVDEIVLLLDYLGIVEPLPIIGHSMGALLASLLAARHPERVSHAILEDPPWPIDPPPDLLSIEREEVQNWLRDLKVWQQWTPDAFFQTKRPEVNWLDIDVEMYVESRLTADLQLFGGVDWVEVLHWEQRCREIQCPVLLITADSDLGAIMTFDATALAMQNLQHGTHIYFPDTDHHIRRMRPIEYTVAVENWLSDN